MPLKLFRFLSFERSLKNLGSNQLKIVGSILEALEIYYSSDCDLEEARKIAPGFFYKQLRRPCYEAGIESNIRVIIRRNKDRCIAILAGDHNQIRNFLKNN